MRPPPAPRRRSRTRPTRGPAAGLAAILLFALASAFFAWVTAEPLWLAAGHAQPGTAAVTRCASGRCAGTFTSTDGRLTRIGIPIMGAAPDEGTAAPARMTSVRGARAYVDIDAGRRTAAGLALLLLCGAGTAWGTGARRLPTARARRIATAACLAAPLALLAAMLAVTY
jgi:hypothetical protein